MPDYNIRNSPQSSILQGEFVDKKDHMFVSAILNGLLTNMLGRRFHVLYSRHDRDASGYPVYYPDDYSAHMFTNAAGAPAQVSPAVVHNPYGWGGNLRLGSTVGYGLYAADHPIYRVTMAEGNIASEIRGMTLFLAFVLPDGWTAPGSGVEYTLYSKWQDAGDLRSYAWGYGFNAGWQLTHGFHFYNSGAGTAATVRGIGPTGATLQLQSGAADWQLILAGVSVEASGGAYFFLNDQWEYVAAPQYDPAALGSMGTNHANASLFTTARRDTTATPAAWDDLYVTFGGMLDMVITPSYWLAFYNFARPVLLYNTNLGGT